MATSIRRARPSKGDPRSRREELLGGDDAGPSPTASRASCRRSPNRRRKVRGMAGAVGRGRHFMAVGVAMLRRSAQRLSGLRISGGSPSLVRFGAVDHWRRGLRQVGLSPTSRLRSSCLRNTMDYLLGWRSWCRGGEAHLIAGVDRRGGRASFQAVNTYLLRPMVHGLVPSFHLRKCSPRDPDGRASRQISWLRSDERPPATGPQGLRGAAGRPPAATRGSSDLRHLGPSPRAVRRAGRPGPSL
jgi:hypothetical protein